MSTIRFTGMASGLDTESIVESLMSAQKLKNKKVEDKKTTLTWKQETWQSLNKKLVDFYKNSVSNLRLTASYNAKKVSSSNEDIVTATGTANAVSGSHTIEVQSLASPQYVTGACINKSGGTTVTDTDGNAITSSTKLSKLNGVTTIAAGTTITIGGKTKTIDSDTTISDVVTLAQSAGLNASYDQTNGRFFISSKTSGTANSFTITSTDSDLLTNIGLGTNATEVPAADSKVIYNGAEITSSTNEFTLNGLTITLKDAVVGEEVNLTVTNDTQATYDMVKDFITSYNSILKELNTYYYADSAKDYSPLSDDEKEDMTDDEIEKWEAKIKDSNLRRDSTLGSLITAMKSSMQTITEIDGKKYSLSTYGITTSSDYTENGLLHIYGNADDSTYSDRTDKLMKALQEDPDTVIDALTDVVSNLYDTMSDKMSSIPNVRSALTFYNDKLMKDQLDDYEDQIDDLDDKLSEMEDRYYKQFTAMETALAKLQAQSSSLASMLGS